VPRWTRRNAKRGAKVPNATLIAILIPMCRRRHSGVPAALLAFVLSAGILLPEAGHSLAHLDASAEVAHHDASHHDGDHHTIDLSEAETEIGEGDQAAHPHLDLLTTIPSSSSLKSLVVAAPSIHDLLPEFLPVSRVINLPPETAPPFVSEHGPPPPSRAPPLT
jgi:hypothetical protein